MFYKFAFTVSISALFFYDFDHNMQFENSFIIRKLTFKIMLYTLEYLVEKKFSFISINSN